MGDQSLKTLVTHFLFFWQTSPLPEEIPMKVFLSICLVAVCFSVFNPALASEVQCQEPKVNINTGSDTSPEQAINLESEIIKLSKVLCQEGLEIYYKMVSNLSIDFVNRKTAFCGTFHSEPDPNGKSKTTLLIDNRYCLLYTSPSPRDKRQSRMPSSA